MPFPWNFRRQTTGANDRAIKTTRSNGMKLRLIETRLLTVKNNVNAFHGNERTYVIQSRHKSSAKQDAKHQLMFSYLDFRCYFQKVMLKLTSISPRDLGESLRRRRRRRRSAFIYHTFHQSIFYSPYFIPSPQSVFYTDRHKFIHTHNLLQYYKVGDKPASKLKESKSKCSSSCQV